MYASVAAQGRFATEPWAGLYTDAYDTSSTGTGTGNKTKHHKQSSGTEHLTPAQRALKAAGLNYGQKKNP